MALLEPAESRSEVQYIFGSAPRPTRGRFRRPIIQFTGVDSMQGVAQATIDCRSSAELGIRTTRQQTVACEPVCRAATPSTDRDVAFTPIPAATSQQVAAAREQGVCQQASQNLFSSQSSSPLTLSQPSPFLPTTSRCGASTTAPDESPSCAKQQAGAQWTCGVLSAKTNSSQCSSPSSDSSSGAFGQLRVRKVARLRAKRSWSLPRLWKRERSHPGMSDDSLPASASSSRFLLRSRRLLRWTLHDFIRARTAQRPSSRAYRGLSLQKLWNPCILLTSSSDGASSTVLRPGRCRRQRRGRRRGRRCRPAYYSKGAYDHVWPLTIENLSLHCLTTSSVAFNKKAALLDYLDSQISLLAFLQAMDPDHDLTRAIAQTDYLMGARWSPSSSSILIPSEGRSAGDEGDSPDTELQISFRNGRKFRVYEAPDGEQWRKDSAGSSDSDSGLERPYHTASSGNRGDVVAFCKGPSERTIQRSTAPSPLPIPPTDMADDPSRLASHIADASGSTVWNCLTGKDDFSNTPPHPARHMSPRLRQYHSRAPSASADQVLDQDLRGPQRLVSVSPSIYRWSTSSDKEGGHASKLDPGTLASPPTPIPRRQTPGRPSSARPLGIASSVKVFNQGSKLASYVDGFVSCREREAFTMGVRLEGHVQ